MSGVWPDLYSSQIANLAGNSKSSVDTQDGLMERMRREQDELRKKLGLTGTARPQKPSEADLERMRSQQEEMRLKLGLTAPLKRRPAANGTLFGGMLARTGTSLSDKIDQWIKLEAARPMREAKRLEQFVLDNAAYLNEKALATLAAFDARGQKRVVDGGTLADAWDAGLLIKARGKDPMEEKLWEAKKRKWGDDNWSETFTLSQLQDSMGIPPPQIFYITIPVETEIVRKGFPNVAACCLYSAVLDIFASADKILEECFGAIDVKDAVLFESDPDMIHNSRFQDIANAITANLGGPGHGHQYTMAVAPGLTKWAIGVGTSPHMCEKSAKISLAFAICFENTEIAERLCRLFTEFGRAWKQMVQGTALDPEAVELALQNVPQLRLVALQNGDTLIAKESLALQGYAIPYNKNLHNMFSYSSQNLQMMLDTAPVDYIDDPDWTLHPGVGAALKQAMFEDDAYAIAVCRRKACWGIGLGHSWKNRQNAAKLALAVVIGLKDKKIIEASEQFEEFCKLCAVTGLITPEQAEAANARRREKEDIHEQHYGGLPRDTFFV